ncbi:MAG: interleukin-like EMT inducer domain-containing protein [Chloroflexota bacterium]
MQALVPVKQKRGNQRLSLAVLRANAWDIAAYSLLIVLPFIVFWAFWSPNLDDRLIMSGDILVGAYPTRVYVHRLLMAGEIPLWNPYQLGGMPLLADIQVAVYYLPNLMLSGIFWGREITFEGFEALVVAHYAIASVLMYGYLRNLKLSTAAALVGAIAFGFNGFLIGHRGHYSMFSVVVWVPGIMWMFDRAWFTKNRWQGLSFTVWAGLLISQMVMGGHPQLTFYCTLFLCCYFLFRGWTLWPFKRPYFYTASNNTFWHPLNQFIFRFGMAGIIAFSISAISLLPMFELLGRSLRSEPTYAFTAQFPLLPRNLITLFIPEFLAWSGTEFRIYAGVLTLVLALVAIIVPKQRRPEQSFFIGATIIALLLAMGGFTASHSFLYRFVPGFSLVRATARIFFFANLSLSVLAAIGAQVLFNQLAGEEKERLLKIVKGSRNILTLMGLLLLAFYMLLAWNYHPAEDDFYFYDSLFVPYFGEDRYLFLTQLVNQFMLFLFFLGGSVLLLYAKANESIKQTVLIVSVIGLMIIDMSTFAPYHDAIRSPGLENVNLDGFLVEQLEWWQLQERNQHLDTLATFPPTVRLDNSEEILADNYSQTWGVSFATGYNVLDLLERFEVFTQWPNLDSTVQWDLMNVGVVLTNAETEAPPETGATLLVDNGYGKLWQRANQPEFAHFSSQLRPANHSLSINGLLLEANGEFYTQPTLASDSGTLAKTLSQSWPEIVDSSLYAIGETGVTSPVDISILSSGVGGYSSIIVDGVTVTPEQRGLIVAAIHPQSGRLLEATAFDTFISDMLSDRFASFIKAVPNGTIVAVATYDEGTAHINENARTALASIGAAETLIDKYGHAYGVIGVKGSEVGTAVEGISPEPLTIDVGIGAYQPAESANFSYSVVNYTQDEIRLFVRNDQIGLLTVSETVFPGWKAYLNGKALPILRSNGIFRSVIVPPMHSNQPNELLFIFDSPVVHQGQLITIIGLSISLFLLVVFSWLKVRHSRQI